MLFKFNLTGIFLRFDGFTINLGPTIIPHKTACLECLNYRKLNNISDKEKLSLFYEEKSFGSTLFQNNVDKSVVRIAGGLLAFELIKLSILNNTLEDSIVQENIPQTIESVLEYNTYTNTVNINEFLKNPKCDICSPVHSWPEDNPWMEDYTFPGGNENNES